ncbi:MAG TPA: hypothetical protein VHR66_14490 [Gemmataceae bacterium]|jgi:hypothetical protein|nr:hypothetical protein [Gemmataceae bacterium]
MSIASHRLLASVVLTTVAFFVGAPTKCRADGKPGEPAAVKPFPVSAMSAEGLIRKPANLFDLEGKTLRFSPQEDGSWKVKTMDTAKLEACETSLPTAGWSPFGAYGWRVELPFAFPFAGKTWNAVHVNNNGNISFAKTEAESIRQRDPWPNSGMRSMAAAIDMRSAAGEEQMVAALWAVYDWRRTKVAVHKADDYLAVTWRVTRQDGDMPVAGENAFQARLFKSGVIEFAYEKVPERDGIIGLFTGQPVKGERIHQWVPKDKAPHPSVDIASATIDDAGSVLRFTVTMREEIPKKIDTESLLHRCEVKHGELRDEFGLSVAGERKGEAWLQARPWVVPHRVDGKTIEFCYSKVLLDGARCFDVTWDAVWWGHPGRFVNSRRDVLSVVAPAGGEIDLSSATGTYAGNVFEIFHYPLMMVHTGPVLRRIYQRVPAEDDLALVLTDFRPDDLFGEGWGTGPINKPVHGIGADAKAPLSGVEFGSKRLLSSMQPNWVGAPKFAAGGRVDDWEWFNYGRAITWIAHEWTHKWGMHLRFRDPKTGKDEDLYDEHGHWRPELHAPPFVAVIDLYTPRPVPAFSIMNGSAWRENPDGTFSKSNHHLRLPGGLSALDLYAMGILPPEKVPDMFLLRDLKGGDRVQATKVTVRIEDIIAAMGPREPSSAKEQKEYRLGVYLLHEPGREADAKMMSRAGELAAAVADFFNRATGGRMSIRPTGQGK